MKIYLVGGAIRDKILHIPVTEKDWVVVGATPEDMLKMGYQQVGKDFPVFLHPKSGEEYALARIDRKFGYGYTGFICHHSPKITIEEDLQRRDLTINAIACDHNGKLIDPYNGLRDIKNRCLRHISISFKEDPLRVLRVARFAAKLFHLNFRVDSNTLLLMKYMKNELLYLPVERIWKETEKALLTSNPHVYFKILRKCGALEVLFPEIDILFGIPTFVSLNKKIDTGLHTLITISEAAKLSEDITVRFSSLCHDFGKSILTKSIHRNYELEGVKIIEKFCSRLKIPIYIRKIAKIVAQYHRMVHKSFNLTSEEIIKLFNSIDVWRNPENLEKIILACKADFFGYIGKKNYLYPQDKFLHAAFNEARLISVRSIISNGFTHEKIKQELDNRRKHAISIWKKNYTTK